ncbi:transforming acidic coiled-coil-containing protein (TACC) domain-containing protein [Phthorimaea operculella]|nr:transforming acidic coiled-coil-containing protein (TACC) domain-containing protein [Phthorimaea operculella]
MAQHVEPMDIDSSVCDFDDKENAFHHNNARTPCTEKGYEELDVSELNMKLRYSVTPAASPMSKSYAGNFDNRNYETENTLEGENGNMTRSLHTTLTKNDTIIKTQKTLPLQSLPTDLAQISDGNRNVLQPLDSTCTVDSNVTVTLTGPTDIDDNISLPSSSSSMAHTPEATTPTKEIPKDEPASPIIRGLKSVLNMFRPSQSPIPGEEDAKLETLSPPIVHSPETRDENNEIVSASTPLVGQKTKDPLTKRNSPPKDSIVFNENLENELEWKDDSTIIFSNEKIPIHKLFFQLPKGSDTKRTLDLSKAETDQIRKVDEGQNMDSSVEYMDISYNDSGIMDKTATSTKTLSELNKSSAHTESDSEFVDCETTFTKNDSFKSHTLDSTEDVLSHIDDLVEPKKDNISSETLNASDAKSANLSAASVETTKQNESILTIANTTQEGKIEEESQADEKIEVAVPSVSDKIDIVHANNLVNEFASDAGTVNSNNQNNESIVVNSPVLENMGVKSLSQIPLIADPRILLFNIPPVVNDNKKEEVSNEDPKTLPADIPLPEDDDIPSLPVMNSELENLSHALDKIAEEIPKINQHESSVSSVGSLSIKSSESPLPENVFSSDVGENMAKPICENSQTQNDIHPETKVEHEVISVENTHPAVNCFPEHETVLNTITATIPEINQVPDNLTEAQAIPENILPPVGEDLNTVTPFSEKPSEDINSVPLSTVPNDTDIIPLLDSEKLSSDLDINVENAEQISVSDSAFAPSELNHAASNAESNILSEIMTQDVEPMDVSMADMQDEKEFDETQQLSIQNVESFAIEQNKNKDFVTFEENECPKTDILSNNVNCTPDSDFKTNTLVTTIVKPDNSEAPITQSDIEFIKQEVDAIIEKAIDIVSEKCNAKTNVDIVDDKIKTENNDLNASLAETKTVDIENTTVDMSLKQAKEKSCYENDSLENTESTKVMNETDVMSSEEEADKQEKSLNLLCANKYSYTVQDNIPAVVLRNYAESAKANNDTFCATETQFVPTSATIDVSFVENDQNNANAVEEMGKRTQSAPTEQEEKILDVTPPDMVKIDPIITTDEEIITSENNSPFVSVSHEIEYPVEVTPIESVDKIENPFASKSIVSMSPPLSPKIVSKGYNFNFDEIDDPFATKTKIRMSPALHAADSKTFEQNINAEPEPLKKEINKNYRRRSQPDRKRPAVNNKKMNSTFSGKSVSGSKPAISAIEATSTQYSEKVKATLESTSPVNVDENSANQNVSINETQKSDCKTEENKTFVESNPPANSNIINGTSSSEQSIYLSAGASSDEAIQVKSDIKVPDLEDSSLNPFATKSKIQQSPPPENVKSPFATRTRICETPPLDTDDPFATKNKMRISPENSVAILNDDIKSVIPRELSNNIEKDTIELFVEEKSKNIEPEKETMHLENHMKLDLPEEKESNENISGTTCSSNNDKESTVREINTEDEDTVEGPFLESDDLQNDEKLSDYESENVDMMQFSEPMQANEDNPDAGELFIDAEAFEFLLNQNANTISDSGKESLFLKFDPLFAKRLSSDGVLAALKHGQTQVKQRTPVKNKRPPIPRDVTFDKSSPLEGSSIQRDATFDKSSPLAGPHIPRDATFDKSSPLVGPHIPRDATFDKSSPLTESPIPKDAKFDEKTPLVAPSIQKDATFDKSSPLAGPSGMNTTQEMDLNSTAEDSYDDLNVTVSKPMMVVNPAVNAVVTPRNKTITPVRSNRHSLTFTSPAIAVIDRLLSMSAANNSLMAHDTTVAEVTRDNEADLALTQLRELLADKEISVYNLRSETKELQNRLASLESQMKNLEMISEDRLKKINDLNEKLNEKAQINKQMAKVVEEYERTIASLIDETAKDKKRHAEERMQLIKERDEQTAHLASMEVSFNDLHSKYEKSKQIIIGFKANEDAYKKSIKEFEENLAKMHKNYELLKQHATSKLNHANEELQKINRAHESEVLKMNAMIKRKELHITSLEETLQQKTKANEELTAICDELINKVG